jgi:hypothetical protein
MSTEYFIPQLEGRKIKLAAEYSQLSIIRANGGDGSHG